MSKPVTEIIEFNPTRRLSKGNIAPFIDMASLPINARDINEISFKEFKGGTKFQNGDILFARITPCLENGKTAKVNCLSDNVIGHGSTEFIVLSAKLPDYDEDYIYYLTRLPEFREFARQRMEGTSGRQRVSWQSLSEFTYDFPEKEIRWKNAQILKVFDDKIQLNTQINQTLEQIAQTIFKSWFIDFDPVHAKANALASGQTLEQVTQAAMAVISGKNTQELHRLQTANLEQYQQLWEIAEAFPSGVDEEGVPRGWRYEKSENLFDVGIGKTPPRKEPEWFSENSNDIEWISIKDMGNSEVFVNKSSEYLLESAVNKFNVKRIPENTVILSFKLTVGRVGITTKETTTNEAIAHFRLCEKSYLTTEFLYLYLKNFDFNNLGSTSSIATAVNSKTIKEMEILYPTLEIINVFQYRVSDIFKTIRSNSEQSNCLEKIRDELLPKLLSGEILNGN